VVPSKKKRSNPAKRGSLLPGHDRYRGARGKVVPQKTYAGSFFIAELERPAEILGRGQLREKPKVEEPRKMILP